MGDLIVATINILFPLIFVSKLDVTLNHTIFKFKRDLTFKKRDLSVISQLLGKKAIGIRVMIV